MTPEQMRGRNMLGSMTLFLLDYITCEWSKVKLKVE